MIEKEVRIQIEKEDGESCRPSGSTRRFLSWKKAAVVALAATMAVGTTVFAGVSLYQWKTQQEGAYGLKTSLTVQETEETSIPEEIPVLTLRPGYLPEGMTGEEEDSLGSWKYHRESTPYQGGLSIRPIAMDRSFSAEELPVSDNYVTSHELMKIQGQEAVYLERQAEGFDKKFYIAYPQYWQILEVFVGEDVSKDEAVKILEELRVEATGKTRLLSEEVTWSELFTGSREEEASDEEYEEKVTATKEEMQNIHSIGEAFAVPMYASAEGEDWEERDCITAKVTEVQTADDFRLLDSRWIEDDLQAALGADQTLLPNEISYVKAGDGVDTLDCIIKTETVCQKLVCVSVEFTNTGEKELRDLVYLASFVGLEETEEGWHYYNRAAKEGADFIKSSSVGGFGEMDYYDFRGGERNNNHISSLQPGETVTVTIAKIVNEDEMGKMYLLLDGSGAGLYFFDDSVLETGYVDIRQ